MLQPVLHILGRNLPFIVKEESIYSPLGSNEKNAFSFLFENKRPKNLVKWK